MRLTNVFDHPDRHRLLYELLAERDKTANISHKQMPCFGDHVRFVESQPYEAWYFICDPEPVGACYLTKQNEIGIQVQKAHHKKGYARSAIKELMEKHGKRRYLANINPQNDPSLFLFRGLGFKPIQMTYELVA